MAQVISALRLSKSPIAKFRELVARIQAAQVRRVAYENSYAALRNISASELREFGLHRSDLPELARATMDRR